MADSWTNLLQRPNAVPQTTLANFYSPPSVNDMLAVAAFGDVQQQRIYQNRILKLRLQAEQKEIDDRAKQEAATLKAINAGGSPLSAGGSSVPPQTSGSQPQTGNILTGMGAMGPLVAPYGQPQIPSGNLLTNPPQPTGAGQGAATSAQPQYKDIYEARAAQAAQERTSARLTKFAEDYKRVGPQGYAAMKAQFDAAYPETKNIDPSKLSLMNGLVHYVLPDGRSVDETPDGKWHVSPQVKQPAEKSPQHVVVRYGQGYAYYDPTRGDYLKDQSGRVLSAPPPASTVPSYGAPVPTAGGTYEQFPTRGGGSPRNTGVQAPSPRVENETQREEQEAAQALRASGNPNPTKEEIAKKREELYPKGTGKRRQFPWQQGVKVDDMYQGKKIVNIGRDKSGKPVQVLLEGETQPVPYSPQR